MWSDQCNYGLLSWGYEKFDIASSSYFLGKENRTIDACLIPQQFYKDYVPESGAKTKIHSQEVEDERDDVAACGIGRDDETLRGSCVYVEAGFDQIADLAEGIETYPDP